MNTYNHSAIDLPPLPKRRTEKKAPEWQAEPPPPRLRGSIKRLWPSATVAIALVIVAIVCLPSLAGSIHKKAIQSKVAELPQPARAIIHYGPSVRVPAFADMEELK